ncbi:MAG: MurR/RpiR family transcriptional regulator [Bulleidia sp.]
MKYQKLPVLLSGVLYGSKPDSPEAVITQYLLDHMHDPDLSIAETAKQCHVGLATVSRYVRNIGFQSFIDLRDSMTMEGEGFEKIEEDDLVEKMCTYNTQAVRQCLSTVDMKKVDRLCQAIGKADRIAVFGLLKGESAAMSLCADLNTLGRQAYTTVSLADQMSYIKDARSDDLIILFSATCAYFEYSDIRRIPALLANRNLWMIGSGTCPSFISHSITYQAGNIPLSHPAQLMAVSQLIAQKYAGSR